MQRGGIAAGVHQHAYPLVSKVVRVEALRQKHGAAVRAVQAVVAQLDRGRRDAAPVAPAQRQRGAVRLAARDAPPHVGRQPPGHGQHVLGHGVLLALVLPRRDGRDEGADRDGAERLRGRGAVGRKTRQARPQIHQHGHAHATRSLLSSFCAAEVRFREGLDHARCGQPRHGRAAASIAQQLAQSADDLRVHRDPESLARRHTAAAGCGGRGTGGRC